MSILTTRRVSDGARYIRCNAVGLQFTVDWKFIKGLRIRFFSSFRGKWAKNLNWTKLGEQKKTKMA